MRFEIEGVIGPLSRECFVIAPDLPGFGGSEPLEMHASSIG